MISAAERFAVDGDDCAEEAAETEVEQAGIFAVGFRF